MWLFAAFLLVPLIEIGLFIQVGGWLGLWPTLGIVVLTAVIGTYLVRSQGLQAMANLRGTFSRLEDPSEALAHGALILFSGALLLTPGFFTDAIGFALLAPPVRSFIIRSVRQRIDVQRFDIGEQTSHQSRERPNDDIVDAEYIDVHDDKPIDAGTSGWTKH